MAATTRHERTHRLHRQIRRQFITHDNEEKLLIRNQLFQGRGRRGTCPPCSLRNSLQRCDFGGTLTRAGLGRPVIDDLFLIFFLVSFRVVQTLYNELLFFLSVIIKALKSGRVKVEVSSLEIPCASLGPRRPRVPVAVRVPVWGRACFCCAVLCARRGLPCPHPREDAVLAPWRVRARLRSGPAAPGQMPLVPPGLGRSAEK